MFLLLLMTMMIAKRIRIVCEGSLFCPSSDGLCASLLACLATAALFVVSVPVPAPASASASAPAPVSVPVSASGAEARLGHFAKQGLGCDPCSAIPFPPVVFAVAAAAAAAASAGAAAARMRTATRRGAATGTWIRPAPRVGRSRGRGGALRSAPAPLPPSASPLLLLLFLLLFSGGRAGCPVLWASSARGPGFLLPLPSLDDLWSKG